MRAFAVALCCAPSLVWAVAPAPGGTVGGTDVVVNAGPGEQNDPHVSDNLAAYTDASSSFLRIHYFNFVTNIDSVIPAAATDNDQLSDVSNGFVAFTRVKADRSAAMVFNVSTSSLTEIAPMVGSSRFGTALGGPTVSYVDAVVGNGDIFASDLTGMLITNISNAPQTDENPAVSPSGDVIVWERINPATGRDIYKSIRIGGLWSPASVVSSTIDQETSPDTDGIDVVYESDRGGLGYDVYFQPLSGGVETRIELAGAQRNPSLSKGIIAFESQGTLPTDKSDLFAYVIASNKLYQITATPNIGEHLNDVTVLSDCSIRVVWAADESSAADPAHDIWARTFVLSDYNCNGSGGGTGGGAGGGGGSGGGSGGGAGGGSGGGQVGGGSGGGQVDGGIDGGTGDDCCCCCRGHGHGHGHGHGKGHCKGHGHGHDDDDEHRDCDKKHGDHGKHCKDDCKCKCNDHGKCKHKHSCESKGDCKSDKDHKHGNCCCCCKVKGDHNDDGHPDNGKGSNGHGDEGSSKKGLESSGSESSAMNEPTTGCASVGGLLPLVIIAIVLGLTTRRLQPAPARKRRRR